MRRNAVAMVLAGALTAAGCGAPRSDEGAGRPWHTMLAAVPATDATRASFVGIDAAAIRTQRGIKPPTGPSDLGDHLRAVYADGSTAASRFVFGYFRKPTALAPELGVAATDIDRVVVAGDTPDTIDIAQGRFRPETVASALAGATGARRRTGGHELIMVGKAGELDPSQASTPPPDRGADRRCRRRHADRHQPRPGHHRSDDRSRTSGIVGRRARLPRDHRDPRARPRHLGAHRRYAAGGHADARRQRAKALARCARLPGGRLGPHRGEHGLTVVFVQRSADDATARADRVRAVLAAERTSAGERLNELLPDATVTVDGSVVVLRAPDAPRGLWARLVIEHTSLLAANG